MKIIISLSPSVPTVSYCCWFENVDLNKDECRHNSHVVHTVELNHCVCVFQGNDQIRFELTCYALYPEVKVSLLLHCSDLQHLLTWCSRSRARHSLSLSLCLCFSDHCTVEGPWILQPFPGKERPDGICWGNSINY